MTRAITGPGPAVYQGSRPLPAAPGPSVALLRQFPPRPVPASWALTSQPKPQVLGRLLAPPFPAGRRNLDQERRRGLIRVLDWLEQQPGDTWQDRWITSGADAAGNPASRVAGRDLYGLEVNRRTIPIEDSYPDTPRAIVDSQQVRSFQHGALLQHRAPRSSHSPRDRFARLSRSS